MITKVADRAADMLYKEGIIPEEECKLYSYGLFLLLSNLLFFCVIIVLGTIMGTLGEGVLFYTQFLLLRGYAGGFHASKEITCIFYTTLILIASIVLLRVMTVMNMNVIPMTVLILSGTVVYFMGPIESEEKPLANEERNRFMQATRKLVVGMILFSIVTKCVGYSFLLNSSVVCMMQESLLLIAGKTQGLGRLKQG